jgi:hypothetical protein
MFNEILQKFAPFHDASILSFKHWFEGTTFNGYFEVYIQCYNHDKGGKYNIVRFLFTSLVFIQINKDFYSNASIVVKEAIVKEDDGVYTFEFFPCIDSNEILVEDEFSEFKIKCKSVKYEILAPT